MRGDETRLPALIDEPDRSHSRVAAVRGVDDAVHTVPPTIVRRGEGGNFSIRLVIAQRVGKELPSRGAEPEAAEEGRLAPVIRMV